MAMRTAKRKKIKIVIVEHDSEFSTKIVRAAEEEDITVIKVCRSIEDAIKFFDDLKTHPDIILLSLEMLRVAAAVHLEYIRNLRTKFSRTKLIIIGDRCTDDGKIALAREGVHGVILRSESLAKIIKCVMIVAAGEIWMDAQIVSTVFEECFRFHEKSGNAIRPPNHLNYKRIESLTTREREILELLSMSMTNEEIARGLYISVDTVKTHVRNIFDKLQVKNRVEAVLFYIGALRGDSEEMAG